MKTIYADLPSRIKAACIDAVLLIILIYLATYVFLIIGDVPNYIRIITFVCFFFLYDPVLTSTFGGTVGHSFSGISVKQENNPQRNLQLHMAILRFVIKVLLGWISLLTVTGNKKKRAIHDYIAQSIVTAVVVEGKTSLKVK